MKVCPNNALHPAFSEAGWEGIWTPVVVPRIGYCEPSCTLCGQVCPTGAIGEFTSREKGWAAVPSGPGADTQPIRLGTAFYDRGRCLPWAMATDCIVCEEWCPTSPKAVYLQPAEVTDAAGNTKQVRQPYIDPERCVGCGACEFVCPVRDRPAVYVTSAGESRSKTNQILLGRAAQTSRPGSRRAATRRGGRRWAKHVCLKPPISGNMWMATPSGICGRASAAPSPRTTAIGDTVEAVADIYLMDAPQGAASIFESEPSAGSRPVALGDAGRSYGQSVTFHQGAFFVRLMAYQDTPQTEAALVSLGQAIERKLGQ